MGFRNAFWAMMSVLPWVVGVPALHAYAAEHVVLYGDADYPPYSYVENGRFQGMYVDILQKAAKLLSPAYEVELIPVPWKRGLNYLETGEGFGLFPPGLKKERTYIQSYSVPLYTEQVVVFCNDRVMKTKPQFFPNDFAGLTMGINAGFLLSDRLMQAVNSGIVKIEAGPSNDSNLRKLSVQRIDCFVSDRGTALYSAKQLRQNDNQFQFIPIEAAALSSEETFIGYSAHAKPPYKADFIKKMDAALNALKSKGEVSKIIKEYLQ